MKVALPGGAKEGVRVPEKRGACFLGGTAVFFWNHVPLLSSRYLDLGENFLYLYVGSNNRKGGINASFGTDIGVAVAGHVIVCLSRAEGKTRGGNGGVERRRFVSDG